jgi:hypothetical protein
MLLVDRSPVTPFRPLGVVDDDSVDRRRFVVVPDTERLL